MTPKTQALINAARARIHGTPALQVVAAPAKQDRELFLQIGRKRWQVDSIPAAVAMFEAARNKWEHGSSKMPRVTIVSGTGLHLYTISYNGRVWDTFGKPLDGETDEQRVARAKAYTKTLLAETHGELN